MTMKPTHDNLIVRRQLAETTSAGGILLQEVEIMNQGEVLAVGPGRTLPTGKILPPSVEVGDVVVFGAYSAGNKVTHNGEELLVLKEIDLLGVLEK